MLVAVSIVAHIVISLKECLKPRDNVAANTGRKLLKSKRNLNSAQSSGGGKYDGLRHGTLGAEAWQLLSLATRIMRISHQGLLYMLTGKSRKNRKTGKL
ncbi:hypothetical protein LWI29_006203 [Acer saccharum]|uniref:Uncharacterized protein n=1 Tax=Acer saccharum TaxID=4024 RepID=A0AA39SCJ8_ACESA|nr:hypothetical protein LWI29_006203 [Acer saccharum]